MANEDPKPRENQVSSLLVKPQNYSGINIGGDTVTQSTEHLEEPQKGLVRWLFNLSRKNNWTWADITKATRIDTSTLYRIWTDKYRDKTGERVNLDKVCERIARFKKEEEARASIVSAKFVETSVWHRVTWLCEQVFVRQKIGFLGGDSQIGKSTCLREHQRRNNHGQTVYAEMPPAGGVQLMTRYIARALFISERSSFDNLLADIIRGLDSSRLLIIDEIHRVFTTYQKSSVMRCLDVLRHIQESTGCGMVLCGTNAFRDEMDHGQFAKYLQQLQRRGLYEVQLPASPPREDIDLVSAEFGLPVAQGEAEDIVLTIAKSHGFGMLITRLTDAASMAKKKGEPIEWAHFVKAHNIITRLAKGSR